MAQKNYEFQCKNCGKIAKAFLYTMGRKKYCSKSCMEQFKHTPIDELIRKNYEIKENGCWEWIGNIVKKTGYGKVFFKGKTLSAHRESFKVHNGEIPFGKHICHTCDNRICVNPDHLWIGSAKENIQDMIKKRRNYDCSGKILSDETKLKISESKKGSMGFWKGKKRSQETKDKISETKRGQRKLLILNDLHR